MTRRSCVLLGAFALASCGHKEESKRYPMEGVVVGLDPSSKLATIKHGAIKGWMGAMTMEYPVKPDSEFNKLQVGDKIQATAVVVGDLQYYVTDVKVTGKQ